MTKLYVVGIGPGGKEQMTEQCKDVITSCDTVVGYTRYMKLVEHLTEGKEIYKTGMHGEVERCQKAVDFAKEGKTTAVVSSGDSGIYGMAGLVYEIVMQQECMDKVEVIVVPGMTSANATASLLGAPLMHDFVTISLSDWLTEMSLIEKRLHCIGQGDFVAVVYNPKSKARPEIINKAQEILLQYKSGDTPVGIVRNAYRESQSVEITTLKDMCDAEIDMLTTLIIGNASTFAANGKMVTPRGYGV